MDWSMVGAVGEVIGAVAVVASLVYVGRQVRHNTEAARSAVLHELTSQAHSFAMSIAGNPTLAAAFARVHRGETRDEVPEVERIQIGYTFVAYLQQIELAFVEAHVGAISLDELHTVVGPGLPLLRSPYLVSLWPVVRPGLREDFAEWMEERYELLTSSGQLPASWRAPANTDAAQDIE